MKTIIEVELPEVLSSHYKEYDIKGFGDIYRAKVSHKIKIGDNFNIYRGQSTKEGCEWLGTLEKSLTEHLKLSTFKF